MPAANSARVPARTNPDVTVLPPSTVRNPEAYENLNSSAIPADMRQRVAAYQTVAGYPVVTAGYSTLAQLTEAMNIHQIVNEQ